MKISRTTATITQMIQRNGSGIEGGPANLETAQTTNQTTQAIRAKVTTQERSPDCPTVNNG